MVSSVPEHGTNSVAEQVFALILNHCRRPALHRELVHQGEWSRREWCFWASPLTEFAGRTLGIIGYGRIGRRVGEIAKSFKMRVLANDPRLTEGVSDGATTFDLSELLAESDISVVSE